MAKIPDEIGGAIKPKRWRIDEDGDPVYGDLDSYILCGTHRAIVTPEAHRALVEIILYYNEKATDEEG